MDDMKKLLADMAKKNVDYPTADRKTWLVRFEYSVHVDGDQVDLDIEAEFENEEDQYIISMTDVDSGRNVFGTEVDDPYITEINQEALATAKAYGLFKEEA